MLTDETVNLLKLTVIHRKNLQNGLMAPIGTAHIRGKCAEVGIQLISACMFVAMTVDFTLVLQAPHTAEVQKQLSFI